MGVIEDELTEVTNYCEKQIEGSTLITCVPALIQVKIKRTDVKQFTVSLQYPASYPDDGLLIELKSKTLPLVLLDHVQRVAEQECKKCLGKPHVLYILRFLRRFIDDNPLSSCHDEVTYIKNNLIGKNDDFKLKQKQGIIFFQCREGRYEMSFTLTVPDNYPIQPVEFAEKSSNFPETVKKVFIGRTIELGRQCTTPPIKKKPNENFVPKPSLRPMAEFLIKNCIKTYPKETCPLCRQQAFPLDPKFVVVDPYSDKFVERVYCGHLYHYACLNLYMKTPPFKGGKPCASRNCGKRIYHERWKATPELAEARWAHHQARQRELDEVVEFLD